MSDRCEIWKDIKDYEGLYKISNYGRVKSLKRVDNSNRNRKNQILKTTLNTNGYFYISLCKDGKIKKRYIHRLVLETFNPINEMDKLYVNHIDGEKTNNNINNLEWCTQSENMRHASKIGLDSKAKKTICLETGKVYFSASECARELGLYSSDISKVCKGNVNHIKGLHFEYYEETL